MDADKFIEQNQPILKVRSKLSKYRSDLLKLKKLGYSHEQIRVFLMGNEITVSVQSISKYFISNLKNNTDSNAENIKPIHASETIPLKTNDPAKNTRSLNIPLRSNSPADLNRVMSAPVDLNAILRAAQKLEDAEKLANQNKIQKLPY